MMISHLKGTVEKVMDNAIVIDVHGVGYKAICSARTLSAVGSGSGTASDASEEGGANAFGKTAQNASGKVVHLFTELSVREDAWTLYGFISESERFWFNKLTSVQGVGGKAAMAILSALSDDDIYNAFLSGDKTPFTRAEGVGPKLASRIVSELKEKIVGKVDPFAISSSSVTATLPENSSVVNDVISALVNLGYQKSDIYRIMTTLDITEDIEFNVLLKQVLQKISAGG